MFKCVETGCKICQLVVLSHLSLFIVWGVCVSAGHVCFGVFLIAVGASQQVCQAVTPLSPAPASFNVWSLTTMESQQLLAESVCLSLYVCLEEKGLKR